MRSFIWYRLVIAVALLSVAMLAFGCSQKNNQKIEDINEEVKSLKDNESRKNYLEGILIELQDLLLEEESRRLHIDAGDKSWKELNDRKAELQEEHFLKISSYFNNYGYPSRAELGQYASYVPYVVLYYSDSDDHYQVDQFKYFYGAYRFNDLPENMFYSYLLRYFEVVQGSEYEERVEETMEDNIYRMMDQLGLEY